MDIVKRLRKWLTEENTYKLLSDAADEIEQLREALRRCVNAINEVEKCEPKLLTYESLRPFLLGAMDNARKALGEKE
jgi:hypothetical protein